MSVRCAGGVAVNVRFVAGRERGDCPSCGKDLLSIGSGGVVYPHAVVENPGPPVSLIELERQLKKHHDLYRYCSVPPELCPECGGPL